MKTPTQIKMFTLFCWLYMKCYTTAVITGAMSQHTS